MSENSSDANAKLDKHTCAHHRPAQNSATSSNLKDDGILSSTKEEAKEDQNVDNVFQITIKLPHTPYEIQVPVSTQELVQDLRQSIMESPGTFQYSCFHLEYQAQHLNDFVELSEVKGLAAGSELKLVEDPYTEKEARMHLARIREIIGAAGNKSDSLYGISAGLSLHDVVAPWRDPNTPPEKSANGNKSNKPHALTDYSFDGPPSLSTLLPPNQDQPPKTIKSISVSPWNPPPPHLRQQGHLLYLQITTNEGEQYQLTSHVSGFFVNKSSNVKFDPFPKPPPKSASAHSLFSLISNLSPSFKKTFEELLEQNNKRDPLANFQLTNAIPSSPWLVSPTMTSLSNHQPDITRTQETYLMSGIENSETLRDWNEELQSTRELPRETVQDRVFRERLVSKIFAEFNEAAARGAMLVARGEIAPLNPTESKDAQIFVYNNVFYSFGADGVGTFTSEGGDEAARVAVGKDVCGVKAVNQLDVAGLATPGTIIVDYLGKRLVAQSIVPGIFKQREPEEHQVDYGGVEGRDVVADNEAFVPTFSQVSKALKVKKHPVWDKEGQKHVLEGSVETKGLLGTDGRKYILDLYRLTPLDVSWLDETQPNDTKDSSSSSNPSKQDYPHRMTVLRPELIESYWRVKMAEYVRGEIDKRKASVKEMEPSKMVNGTHENSSKSSEPGEVKDLSGTTEQDTNLDSEQKTEPERVDISNFSLSFNPDVFCGQEPQTEEEKEDWGKDEHEVRNVCDHLRQKAIPDLIHDVEIGEIGFPMDGLSLSQLMHKRGINIRYLGKLLDRANIQDARLRALRALAEQEMIARAFKHAANRYLKNLPAIFATNCLAHLLNCLLGTGLNKSPTPHIDEDIQDFYKDADYSFTKVTPGSLKSDIEVQVQIRYRHTLDEAWVQDVKSIQLLRSISLKLGLQLSAKDYRFSTDSQLSNGSSVLTNGNGVAHNGVNGHVNGNASSKKKKKNGGRSSPIGSDEGVAPSQQSTFAPSDIANLIPVIKDACPKSILAEEALEAGKISMMQNQAEIGRELLLESLTLHEQIYGSLHPEVARVNHQLATLYYQLDEKNLAIDLAHKAVIISERTLGIDSNETILAYLNLAYFENGSGNTDVALACVRHALELWKIVYGSKHPDSITTLNNAAVMLQQRDLYPESRQWFEVSLAISEEVSGKSSVNTATLLFQLAQALVLDRDHKGAVHRMREAYSIFLSKLGAEHPNTKESEKLLEHLTTNAVSVAKHEKDTQARRTRRVLFNPRVATLGAHTQPQMGQTTANLVDSSDSRSSRFNDSRSIEELMNFIEGGSDRHKTSPAKKRSTRGNPRRRGASTIGATA